MAPSIIASDAVQGEAFLPGQIFVFGGFALRANSLPFPLHSCKLHALLSAANILFACLLELCDDCLTCPKIAKIYQELKLVKG